MASPILASVTARPAEKGTDTEKLDPALVRRTIDGIVSVTGCRRKEARERVAAWHAGGKPLADLEAYLRATYRLDPTGVTAARQATKADPDGRRQRERARLAEAGGTHG